MRARIHQCGDDRPERVTANGRTIRICVAADELDSSVQPCLGSEGYDGADEFEGALCSWTGKTQTDPADAPQGVEGEGSTGESAEATGCFDQGACTGAGGIEE